MKVLVACEFSGVVREAFRKLGHDAWSCDILPTEQPSEYHCQGDVLTYLKWKHNYFDLMIAHPPCTHIAVSGARHFAEKQKDGRQQQGIDFFLKLANAHIPRIAIENPVGIMSSIWRQPDQIIQPYEFGENAKKTTCLWLKNLPKLKPTNTITPEMVTLTNGKKFSAWEYKISMNHNERSHLRSKTFQGIANAMAEQWGNYKPVQTELIRT